MALDTTTLAADVRRLLGGVSTDEYSATAMTAAINAGLRTFARWQPKTADVSLSVSAGVDRYACPVAAVGVLAHSWCGGSVSPSGYNITGYDNVVSAGGMNTGLGDIATGMAAMDAFLTDYETDQLAGSPGSVRLEGGDLVIDPPPDQAGTMVVRLAVAPTTTTFPTDALAYDALKFEVAYLAGQEVVAGRLKFGEVKVGPKKVELREPMRLMQMCDRYHEQFLALVGHSSGPRT